MFIRHADNSLTIPTKNVHTYLANMKQSVTAHNCISWQQTAFSHITADQRCQSRHYLHSSQSTSHTQLISYSLQQSSLQFPSVLQWRLHCCTILPHSSVHVIHSNMLTLIMR